MHQYTQLIVFVLLFSGVEWLTDRTWGRYVVGGALLHAAIIARTVPGMILYAAFGAFTVWSGRREDARREAELLDRERRQFVTRAMHDRRYRMDPATLAEVRRLYDAGDLLGAQRVVLDGLRRPH